MKRYTWRDNGEIRGSAEMVWIYEWDPPDNDFAALGPVSRLVRG